MDQKDKLFAAYCAKVVDGNPLTACYPLVENALVSAGYKEFTACDACRVLDERYGIYLDVGVVRQVLTVGLTRMRMKLTKQTYRLTVANSKDVEQSDFDCRFRELVSQYVAFCDAEGYLHPNGEKASELIVSTLNRIDAAVITGGGFFSEAISKAASVDYSFCKFVEHCAQKELQTFDFVVLLCLSNLRIESLLYSAECSVRLADLVVYVDTPIIYALMQLSDDASNKIYPGLIDALRSLGAKIQILDRNWDEFKSALLSTKEWAYGPRYNAVAANMCARVMRQTWKTKPECDVAIRQRIDSLKDSGVSIRFTEYNRAEDRYQIDEQLLSDRISKLYHGGTLGLRDRKVDVDTTAVSMVYRIRRGGVAYRISDARYVLMTSNGALAKACKLFDRAVRKATRNRPAVPACVHSDLIATLVWVAKPKEYERYQKYRLLSLCYQEELPSKELIQAFSDQLEAMKSSGTISDSDYVLMRCGAVVDQVLMRITNGDQNEIDNRMVERVKDAIVQDARKEFDSEREAFQIQLDSKDEVIQELTNRNAESEKHRDLLNAKVEDYRRCIELQSRELAAWLLRIIVFAVALLLFLGLFILGMGAWVSLLVAIGFFLVETFRIGSDRSVLGKVRLKIASALTRRAEPALENRDEH